jgi:hypothetical protein
VLRVLRAHHDAKSRVLRAHHPHGPRDGGTRIGTVPTVKDLLETRRGLDDGTRAGYMVVACLLRKRGARRATISVRY